MTICCLSYFLRNAFKLLNLQKVDDQLSVLSASPNTGNRFDLSSRAGLTSLDGVRGQPVDPSFIIRVKFAESLSDCYWVSHKWPAGFCYDISIGHLEAPAFCGQSWNGSI